MHRATSGEPVSDRSRRFGDFGDFGHVGGFGHFGRLTAALALSLAFIQPVIAREVPDEALGTIQVRQLPNDAQETLERIGAGGPFPYAKDGARFGNYERMLPQRPRGYYREYTVNNSNSRNRGAKRIVCGGEQAAANDCYYTDDHYNSFKRIAK
jgi:ribonuclease T1